jgi:hypothetical protein
MEFKICTKCKETKQITDFCKDKYKKDGYCCWCKICDRIRKDKWRKNNKDKLREYYLNNKDKIISINKQWSENNKERVKENYSRWVNNNYIKYRETIVKWQKDNPDKIKEYRKKYNAKYPEKQSERGKIYYRGNKEKINIKHKNYRKNSKDKRKIYVNKLLSVPRNRLNRNMAGGMWSSLKGNKQGRHWESLVNYNTQDLMDYLEIRFQPDMTWENYGTWHVDHIIPISLWQFESYNDREFKQCWALCNLQPLWGVENMSKGNRI